MSASTPRSFDPVALGGHECDAWVGYYRRDWRLVLRAAVGMVRVGFGLSWPATLRGAWYVLRANQVWAPYPDNDPDAARAFMRRFYALVAAAHRLPLDPVEAARLDPTDARVAKERGLLVRSYTSLLAAVTG